MAENNESPSFTYLKLPSDYHCIYNKLLIDLSSLGIKGLTEGCRDFSMPCNNTSSIVGDCRDISSVFDSWNMFQIGCAAYDLGEFEKADKIMDYINRKMNYCCTKTSRVYGNVIYFGQSNSKPDNTTILSSNSHSPNLNNYFDTGKISTVGHFIAIPREYSIRSIENSSFRGDWLYNINSSTDLYTREDISLGGIDYVLWYCEFIIPFNASIEVTLGV